MTINYQYNHTQPITKVNIALSDSAGHADHWHILTDNITEDVPNWLQNMIDTAVMPHGLSSAKKNNSDKLLIAQNNDAHISQVLAVNDGKPQQLINAFPCVNSPYGITCDIERVIICNETCDAVLRLHREDGTIIYAYDQLYAINGSHYQKNKPYYVNFSAWAYNIKISNQDEALLIDDPQAIHYHRAFNHIVATNEGQVPENIQELIQAWKPETDEPLAPVEINFGNMCAYLFGETLGQEDEAWCQGQVLGKQQTQFFDQDIFLFDVAILREPNVTPLVLRIGAVINEETQTINVNDYIQANIWLQAAIYAQNQNE